MATKIKILHVVGFFIYVAAGLCLLLTIPALFFDIQWFFALLWSAVSFGIFGLLIDLFLDVIRILRRVEANQETTLALLLKRLIRSKRVRSISTVLFLFFYAGCGAIFGADCVAVSGASGCST